MNQTNTTLDRRQFLGAAAAGGLTLTFSLGMAPRGAHAQSTTNTVNSCLIIGLDNSVTLMIGSSDMGQGSFAGLAQIMSEDLMVNYSRIQLVQGGPVMSTPAPFGTAIMTGGSSVTRRNYANARTAAATAREMLVQAAMQKTGDSNRNNYSVVDGTVVHSSGSYTYGSLAAAASGITLASTPTLVSADQFKAIGKPLPRLDIPAKVDGSAKFGLDVRLPNMVYAAVKHCPTVGGKLATTPAKPAAALAVVPLKFMTAASGGLGRGANLEGNVNAVAVVASTTWDAMNMARSLSVSWTLPSGYTTWNTAQFVSDAKALSQAASPAGLYNVEGATTSGTTLTALNSSPKQVDATYTLPFVPHACMEVLNCTVDYVPGVRCHVYAPTQGSKSALSLVMAMTNMSESQVRINTTLLGGGLGRKIELDFIAQAVQVGMALQRPVQLVWSREEDFTHGQYRPMAVVRARAGLDASNNIAAWVYRNVSPSISAQRRAISTADSQAYEGANALPYAMSNRLVEWVNQPTPIPVGYWRSVGASINTFVVESLIDELALQAGTEPYRFRMDRLGASTRWQGVLSAAATLAGWGTSPPAGSARGIAIGTAFDSIVACVVEIAGYTTSAVKITKVSVAIDCGMVVNPLSVEAQIVGGVIHGINATLYGQQTFSNGVAQRANFNTNPMIKLNTTPQIKVSIVPSTAPMGGVGELGVPTLAPALTNAIAKLTGTRIRSLPLYPSATMGGL